MFLQVIDLELPITVKLSVVDVDPGLRGDTAQGDAILFIPGNYYLSNLYCKHWSKLLI